LLGRELPDDLSMVLFVGIFAVWFPAMLVVVALRAKLRQEGGRGFYKAAFAGAPMWMAIVAFVALGYAALNFFLATGMPVGSVSDKNPEFQRVASGHAMAFYAAAMTILYAAAVRADPPRCYNGHKLGAGQETCGVCGAALIRDSAEAPPPHS
jgi:hypothetical protein